MVRPWMASASTPREVRDIVHSMWRRAFALTFIACGARTELGAPEEVDASFDAVADAMKDVVIITDAGCTTDAECNDSIACTIDACDPNLHVCTHAPRDTLCDDGVFCNGDETCDPNAGCVTAPRSCADAVSCTVDACDESKKACTHTPDDSLCPISHICDPVLDCQAHALAHDDTTLFDVRLPSGQVNILGSTNFQLTDIALSPSNVLYGIGFGALYTVSQQTGAAMFSKSINGSSLNGADVSPDGTLWVSGGSELATLDTSGTLTFVASFPSGATSSGDLRVGRLAPLGDGGWWRRRRARRVRRREQNVEGARAVRLRMHLGARRIRHGALRAHVRRTRALARHDDRRRDAAEFVERDVLGCVGALIRNPRRTCARSSRTSRPLAPSP